MRAACIFITRIRAKAELHRRMDLVDCAFVIVDRTGAPAPVMDLSPVAKGVLPGMTLQQAVSVQSGLKVLDADEPHYRDTFERLLDSLDSVSDMVEDGGLGEAYVRLDGLERLYRGEAGVASALLNAIPDRFNPRVGVAGSKFAAYAAARTARPMRAVKTPDDARAFLAPMPIDILPVSVELKTGLLRFGMRLIGDLAAMGRTAMFDRFGQEGLVAWELSTGIDRRPFTPRKMEESVVENTTLPFRTTSMETLRVGLDILLRRAFARSALRNRSAGAATLASAASDVESWKLNTRFRIPVERWERASELLGERVEREPPPYPVSDLSLTLAELAGESGVQAGLIRDARERGLETLVEADRRLRGRAGGQPALYRTTVVAPEMRSLLVPIDPLASGAVRALCLPAPAEVSEAVNASGRGPLAVRIGGRWRDIRRIEERWTFDLWWLPQPMARSYYRVESSDGSLLTLFRDETTGLWYSQAA